MVRPSVIVWWASFYSVSAPLALVGPSIAVSQPLKILEETEPDINNINICAISQTVAWKNTSVYLERR